MDNTDREHAQHLFETLTDFELRMCSKLGLDFLTAGLPEIEQIIDNLLNDRALYHMVREECIAEPIVNYKGKKEYQNV